MTPPRAETSRPRPRVVAHRTCPLDAPENSLAGIAAAARLGADAVEVDVRRTSDGVPVLLHDRTPWRTARSPVPPRARTADRYARLRHRGTPDPLPTLAEALAAVPPGVALAVDVKEAAAMPAVLAAVAGHPGEVWLWCRDAAALARVRAWPTALLRVTAGAAATLRYLDDAVAAGATAVSLHQRAVTPDVVAAAHARGLVAYAWVVERDAHRAVLDSGVDGVVTDWPEYARELLG